MHTHSPALAHTHTHKDTLAHTHTHSLTHTHTHTQTRSPAQTHTHSHRLPHSLPHTHSLTPTHTYTCTHLFSRRGALPPLLLPSSSFSSLSPYQKGSRVSCLSVSLTDLLRLLVRFLLFLSSRFTHLSACLSPFNDFCRSICLRLLQPPTNCPSLSLTFPLSLLPSLPPSSVTRPE